MKTITTRIAAGLLGGAALVLANPITAAPQITLGTVSAWPTTSPYGGYQNLPVDLSTDVAVAGLQFEFNYPTGVVLDASSAVALNSALAQTHRLDYKLDSTNRKLFVILQPTAGSVTTLPSGTNLMNIRASVTGSYVPPPED